MAKWVESVCQYSYLCFGHVGKQHFAIGCTNVSYCWCCCLRNGISQPEPGITIFESIVNALQQSERQRERERVIVILLFHCLFNGIVIFAHTNGILHVRSANIEWIYSWQHSKSQYIFTLLSFAMHCIQKNIRKNEAKIFKKKVNKARCEFYLEEIDS